MSGTFTVLLNFNNTNGYLASSNLTDINGVLYGTTEEGGSSSVGTLYSYNPSNGQFQTLINFNNSGGTGPLTSVTDVNGVLYGTAYNGGASSDGTLYSYNPSTGQTQTLLSFSGTNGANPQSDLLNVNGTLYGTTLNGGAASDGNLYSYNTSTGQYQSLADFNNGNSSQFPVGSLLNVNGTLYGTTEYGGLANAGTIFSYNIASNQLVTAANFIGSNGAAPQAGMVDVNGTLYGTTDLGGSSGEGTVFSYNPSTASITTLVNFTFANGALPNADLLNVNGTLYGTTSGGNPSGDGTLFSYNIANGTFQTLINFTGTNGNSPAASLTDINNTLYGTTQLGGSSDHGELFSYTLPCFAQGTRILTTSGEIPVERLEPGSQIILHDNTIAPVVWLGHRTLSLRRHPRPEQVRPIHIQAGALADNIPHRDLFLSPDHALYLDGALIPAKCLINGSTIRQINVASVTYYHVELPAHAILLAEGTPTESYLETGNRHAFTNGSDSHLTLHPNFAQTQREQQSCAPFTEYGPLVETVRTRLLARANIPLTTDPALSLQTNKDGSVTILSRSGIPGQLNPDPRDQRRLGVKIASLEIGGAKIPLDHPLLTEGWHNPEPDGRWTNGRSVIPAELVRGEKIVIAPAATLAYPADQRTSEHACA